MKLKRTTYICNMLKDVGVLEEDKRGFKITSEFRERTIPSYKIMIVYNMLNDDNIFRLTLISFFKDSLFLLSEDDIKDSIDILKTMARRTSR